MITSHQPITTPYTITARDAPHHSGHQEYGGKKPSSPAPSAISASLRSSGRGSIFLAWKPRDRVPIAISRVVMTSAEVPVQSPAISQYAGLTTTKKAVEIPKIQASTFMRAPRAGASATGRVVTWLSLVVVHLVAQVLGATLHVRCV